MRKTLISTLFGLSVAFGGAVATAQEATPDADSVEYLSVDPQVVRNADGKFAGSVSLWEDEDGVNLVLKGLAGDALEPGEYVVHIHENGVCEAEGEQGFDSAGGHFDATHEEEGDAHGEDELMTVEEDGSFEFWTTLSDVTLEPGTENSLNGEQGSSIVIHEGADATEDEENRVACGVIFAPIEEGPEGTPVATPEE